MKRIAPAVLAVAGLCAFGTIPASAVPIVNPGFETGDFTGWTQSGITAFVGVQCPGPGSVHGGNCDAFFGAVGSDSFISQDLATVPGQSYEIRFWFDPDGGVTSHFSLSFGGITLST